MPFLFYTELTYIYVGLSLGSLFCSVCGYKLLLNHNCGKCYARKAQDTMRIYSGGIGQAFHFFALSILLLS